MIKNSQNNLEKKTKLMIHASQLQSLLQSHSIQESVVLV